VSRPPCVLDMVVEKTKVAKDTIRSIAVVNSGFSITPTNQTSRAILLGGFEAMSAIGAKIEAPSDWVSIIIPAVPKSLRRVGGITPTTSDMVMAEVKHASGTQPVAAGPYGRGASDRLTQS